MSLKDYEVRRDHFEDGAPESGLCFPCHSCKHNEKKDSEEPCKSCDHNAGAVEEEEGNEHDAL